MSSLNSGSVPKPHSGRLHLLQDAESEHEQEAEPRELGRAVVCSVNSDHHHLPGPTAPGVAPEAGPRTQVAPSASTSSS